MAELKKTREEMEEGMFDALTELKELLQPEIEMGIEKMFHTPGAGFPIEFQLAEFPVGLFGAPKESSESDEGQIYLGVGQLFMKNREPLSDTDKNVTIPRVQELITQMSTCAFDYTHNPLTEGRSTKLTWHTKKDLLVVSYEGIAAVNIDFSYDDEAAEDGSEDNSGAKDAGDNGAKDPAS